MTQTKVEAPFVEGGGGSSFKNLLINGDMQIWQRGTAATAATSAYVGVDRWKILEGVVDTDNYVNVINFPFILKKRDEQFLIKKGDPMVQLFPFKRESWKSWVGFYHEKLHSKTMNMLGSKWVDRYKTMFWNKKNYR